MEKNQCRNRTNNSVKESIGRKGGYGSTGGFEKRSHAFSFMTSEPPSYLKPPKPPKQPKQGN